MTHIFGAPVGNYVLPLKIVGWVDLPSRSEKSASVDIRVAVCVRAVHSAVSSSVARRTPTFVASLRRNDRPPICELRERRREIEASVDNLAKVGARVRIPSPAPISQKYLNNFIPLV